MKFSVRETKRLKRLIKHRFGGNEIDYESLLYEFPGKTLEHLRETSEEIIAHRRGRRNKNRKQE